MFGAPDCALDEEMVTMRPQPAASMSGIAACTQLNVPVRLTARIRSHRSAVMSTKRRERLDTGAGHEDLDGTEIRAHLRERGVDRRAVGDVDFEADGPLPPRGGFGLGGFAVQVEQRDAVAVGGELLRAPSPMPDAAPVTTATRLTALRSLAPAGVNSKCSSVRPRRTHVGAYEAASARGPWCSSERRMSCIWSRMRSRLTRPSDRANGAPGQE